MIMVGVKLVEPREMVHLQGDEWRATLFYFLREDVHTLQDKSKMNLR